MTHRIYINSITSIHILDRNCLARYALRQCCHNEVVDITVQHVAWRGRCRTGPQIFDQLIRLQYVRPDLVTPADFGQLLFAFLQPKP